MENNDKKFDGRALSLAECKEKFHRMTGLDFMPEVERQAGTLGIGNLSPMEITQGLTSGSIPHTPIYNALLRRTPNIEDIKALKERHQEMFQMIKERSEMSRSLVKHRKGTLSRLKHLVTTEAVLDVLFGYYGGDLNPFADGKVPYRSLIVLGNITTKKALALGIVNHIKQHTLKYSLVVGGETHYKIDIIHACEIDYGLMTEEERFHFISGPSNKCREPYIKSTRNLTEAIPLTSFT